jgi:hypothetical protein
MFENQGDCLSEAAEALLSRASLAIRAGHLGAIGDVPIPIAFDDRRELVAHPVT